MCTTEIYEVPKHGSSRNLHVSNAVLLDIIWQYFGFHTTVKPLLDKKAINLAFPRLFVCSIFRFPLHWTKIFLLVWVRVHWQIECHWFSWTQKMQCSTESFENKAAIFRVPPKTVRTVDHLTFSWREMLNILSCSKLASLLYLLFIRQWFPFVHDSLDPSLCWSWVHER